MGTAPKNLLKVLAGNLECKKGSSRCGGCGHGLYSQASKFLFRSTRYPTLSSGDFRVWDCGFCSHGKGSWSQPCACWVQGRHPGHLLGVQEDPTQLGRTGAVLVATGQLHGQLGMELAWETGYPGGYPKRVTQTGTAALSSSCGQLGVQELSVAYLVCNPCPSPCLNASFTLCPGTGQALHPQHGMEQLLLQRHSQGAAWLGQMSQNRKDRNKNKQMEEMEVTHERHSK